MTSETHHLARIWKISESYRAMLGQYVKFSNHRYIVLLPYWKSKLNTVATYVAMHTGIFLGGARAYFKHCINRLANHQPV